MALVVKDRVQETTTTTGTGTVTLAGAVTGFQSFSVIGDGNTTYYSITGGSEWELGIGTYTASGTTLSRDTVLESSNGGSLVNFSAGSKSVFCTYPAERSMYVDGTTITPATTATLPVSFGGTGSNTLTANNVILGNGTSAVQFVAPGTTGNVLTSNGTTWTSAAASSGTPTVNEYNTPTTGATWTKPASANFVLIEVWGGGGSGGKSNNAFAGGGGGGGAYSSALVKFSDLVGAVTYDVASGGASRTTAGVGNAGGTSKVDMASFQSGATKTINAFGGGGGGGGTSIVGGGGGGGGQISVGSVGGTSGGGSAPGGGTGRPNANGNGSGGNGVASSGCGPTVPTPGDDNYFGGGGGGGGSNTAGSTATTGRGGSTVYGGAGGGGGNATTTAGAGGTSVWGGAGSAGQTGATASNAGTQPGGGSGGTETGNSGAGGDGRVRFTYW